MTSPKNAPAGKPEERQQEAALTLLRSDFTVLPTSNNAVIGGALSRAKLWAQFMEAHENGKLSEFNPPKGFIVRRAFQKAKTQAFLKAAAAIQESFSSENIPFALIKGIGLAKAYGSIYARESGDLDILVTPGSLKAAHDALISIGGVQATSHKTTMSIEEYSNFRRDYQPEYPLKSKPDSIQALPYFLSQGNSLLRVELHDGLYYLPQSLARQFVSQARPIDLCEDMSPLPLPTLEHQLLLLVANTFENSESSYANAKANRISLQDYCDIRFFLERHENKIDWNLFRRLATSLANESILPVIVGNLQELYPNHNFAKLLTCVNGKTQPSAWNIPVAERAFNEELCKSNALAIEKKRLRGMPLTKLVALGANTENRQFGVEGDSPSNHDGVYSLAIENNTLIVRWKIEPDEMPQQSDILFSVSLFFANSSIPYLQLSVYFLASAIPGKSYCFVQKSYRPYQMPTTERKNIRVELLQQQSEAGEIAVEARIKEHVHLSSHLEQEDVFVSSMVYQRVFGDVFHPIDKSAETSRAFGASHHQRISG